MAAYLRLLLAVIAGLAVGSAVNMGLIVLGGRIVAPPAGADVTTMEGLRASMHLFEARHFVFPFLAHALGTLAGAALAALLAPPARAMAATAAGVVGAAFLVGGIANVLVLPAPPWFSALDLLLAYGPAAWLGRALVLRWRPASRAAG
jgi:hypothetical protein